MSMLAEPRRKKAWVLNPKGSQWSQDDSKFGQKMLEQMGWSKGQGLGKAKNGIREHIRPSVQNDSRGLGYEGRSDDWVAHLDNFNDLLAQLQQDQTDVKPTGTTDKQPKSLEERSKKSKARVHYHKFTRGKDLSRASSRDLACILGGRSGDGGGAASQPVTPVSSRPPSPPSHADSEPEPEPDQQERRNTEVDSNGYMTIHSGQSCQDYFAEKMRKLNMIRLKNKRKNGSGTTLDEGEPLTSEKTEETRPSTSGVEPVIRQAVDLAAYATSAQEQVQEKGSISKKKKKRKKEPDTTREYEASDSALPHLESTVDVHPPKKKKKRKGDSIDAFLDTPAVSEEQDSKTHKARNRSGDQSPGTIGHKKEDDALDNTGNENGNGKRGESKKQRGARGKDQSSVPDSSGHNKKKKKRKSEEIVS